MTFLCTLLSMPAYILFWSGNVLNNPDTTTEKVTFDTFIASISLANLGDNSKSLNQLDINNSTSTIEMFCEIGNIGKSSAYRIAVINEDDENEEYD